jgi:hypothetical protein
MSTPAWEVAGLALLAGLLLCAAVWVLLSHHEAPEKRERKRRLALNERGRLGSGTVTDVGPHAIYYTYFVAGVEYQTAQDVTQLAEFMPADPDRLIGPATLKYSPRNPANSILLCEKWSGLRNTIKETLSNDA